jgi:uncharacterized protein YpmB
MKEKEQQNEIGTISGILIIILMVVLGGFYFFQQDMQRQKQIEALRQQIASSTQPDDLNSIQNDATSLDFKNLGNGVDNLK